MVAYKFSLPPFLLYLHDVIHVSQLQKYIPDRSHVIQVDDVQVREILTVEEAPLKSLDIQGDYIRKYCLGRTF